MKKLTQKILSTIDWKKYIQYTTTRGGIILNINGKTVPIPEWYLDDFYKIKKTYVSRFQKKLLENDVNIYDLDLGPVESIIYKNDEICWTCCGHFLTEYQQCPTCGDTYHSDDVIFERMLTA